MFVDKIVETWRDAAAITKDVIHAPVAIPYNLYKSLRNGWDIWGSDPKALWQISAQHTVVERPKGVMASAACVVLSELFKSSLGPVFGGVASMFAPERLGLNIVVGLVVSKTLVDIGSVALAGASGSHAGTGAPIMPNWSIRKAKKGAYKHSPQ